MKILVTGADGFVGRHLINELVNHGHEVIATSIHAGTLETVRGPVELHALDVTSLDACVSITSLHKPEATVHLAGLAHTKDTEKNLPKLFDVNVASVSHMAHAMKQLTEGGSRSFLMISSAFVYGGDVKTGRLACDEATPVVPRGAYGQSKLAAESVARLYDGSGLDVYVARPFNHIGPGQHPSFVVAGFAERISKAVDGSTIETGGLHSKRDFTDVRDIVRAYRLILEKKPKEKTFVLGSGSSVTIGAVFEEMCRLARKQLLAKTRDDLLRTGDESELIAQASLADAALGWRPEISLPKSLSDALASASSLS